VHVASLSSGDAEGDCQWEVQTPDGCTSYWEAPQALTVVEGGALEHGVTGVSSRVLAFAYRLLFRCKNSDVSNLNI
jgi:hypothetical protein